REIADPVGRPAVGRDKLAGQSIHPLFSCRVERIEPMKPCETAEFEIDDGRQRECVRRQRPAARAVEPPREQALPRLRRPIRPGRGERLPAIPNFAALLSLGVAAVENIDAEAEKPLATRGYQPRGPTIRGQRPAARRCRREISTSPSCATEIGG